MRWFVAVLAVLASGCVSGGEPAGEGRTGHLDWFLLQVENDSGQITRFHLHLDGREVCNEELRDLHRTQLEDCVPSYAKSGTNTDHEFSMTVEYEDGRNLEESFTTKWEGLTFVIKHFSVELEEHCTSDPRARPEYNCENWRP